MKKISVLLTGPTGGAGFGVLDACLKHPAVARVTAVHRRKVDVKHEKLVQVRHDNFMDYSKIEKKLKGHDAMFWCLGIAQSKVKKDEYHRITYDFTVEAAKVLERLNPGMTFCFLSGQGADPKEKSRILFARVKGKTENALDKYDLKVYKFRPGFIHPMPPMKTDYISMRILYPLVKNSKGLVSEADEIGRAMIRVALNGHDTDVLDNRTIRELGKKT